MFKSLQNCLQDMSFHGKSFLNLKLNYSLFLTFTFCMKTNRNELVAGEMVIRVLGEHSNFDKLISKNRSLLWTYLIEL